MNNAPILERIHDQKKIKQFNKNAADPKKIQSG
jgi:hypothetical protein